MDKYLPNSYELHLNNRLGKYIITDIIGKGASTVAYSANYYDSEGNCSKHIIKEFNPSYISFGREENGEIKFRSCDENKVKDAKERFISSCKKQIEIRNQTDTMNQTPYVEGPFIANNTVYIDVVIYNGTTYDIAYDDLSLCDKMEVCLSVAKLVKSYHDNGYLCLDIKPKNILVIPETKEIVFFIDFDSVCKKEDIVFGNSISYTKQWAAPEQLNPYAKDDISEATDIYAIGELVFWSVFERHSTMEDHRSFSVYNFEELSCHIRHQVGNILTDLFHNTLRSSANNRFTINETIDLLESLIEELSKKEYIIESVIRPNEFFMGRDKELDELDRRLKEEKLIFLFGIGGIGKSEIAKQYAKSNAHRYRNILYWTFNGDFKSTICQDNNVLINTITRLKDESDHSYCGRKLKAMKNCLQDNNLLIIDNMDRKLVDISNDIWKDLRSLPCDIIVTTRSKQVEHNLLVSEIADLNSLREIFTRNCPYSDIDSSQDEYIDEIICCLNRHTLLVELIAKQTYAAGRSPKETMELLNSHGISGTGKETVGMIKDGDITCETVLDHVKKLFSMSAMTFEQQLLLTKAAFLPEFGISKKDFCAYYGLEDKNGVNWFVENGWINCSSDSNSILTVHPVITEVVLEEFKDNIKLQRPFYLYLNDAFIWDSATIKQIAHTQISASIADKTKKFEIGTRFSAVCLIKYVEYFSTYGNPKNNYEQIGYAISILENIFPKQKYSVVLEKAYLTYIKYVKEQSSLDKAIKLCHEHLSVVKKEKDLYLIGRYYILLSSLITAKNNLNENKESDILSRLSAVKDESVVIKAFKYIVKLDHKQKKCKKLNDFSNSWTAEKTESDFFSLMSEYIEFFGNMDLDIFFCKNRHISSICKSEIIRINTVIRYREDYMPTGECLISDNSVNNIIDEARILYLEKEYDKAIESLTIIIQTFISKNRLPTIPLYHVHWFLGNIYATIGDYKNAITEMKHCNEIGKELQLQKDYSVNVQLGRFLNEFCERAVINSEEYKETLENSEQHNNVIKAEVEQLVSHKSFLGDTLYNLATIQKLKGNLDEALKIYEQAIDEYQNCNGRSAFVYIGKARCYRKMYDIYQKIGLEDKAKTSFENARRYYSRCLDNDHPEVTDFFNTLL